MSGIARASIDSGSALGVKPATKRVIPKTQARQGLKIAFPDRNPMRLKVIRNTGSSNAIPKSKIALITKSK
jgi:hypothetical protein